MNPPIQKFELIVTNQLFGCHRHNDTCDRKAYGTKEPKTIIRTGSIRDAVRQIAPDRNSVDNALDKSVISFSGHNTKVPQQKYKR